MTPSTSPTTTSLEHSPAPQLYAVRMSSGDQSTGDFVVTTVGVTDDLAKAEAYVAKQEAVLAALVQKYQEMAPFLEEHTAAHPCPHQLPEQSYTDFEAALRQWLANMGTFSRQWLADNLTAEEAALDAIRDGNEWCIEPVAWLP